MLGVSKIDTNDDCRVNVKYESIFHEAYAKSFPFGWCLLVVYSTWFHRNNLFQV